MKQVGTDKIPTETLSNDKCTSRIVYHMFLVWHRVIFLVLFIAKKQVKIMETRFDIVA